MPGAVSRRAAKNDTDALPTINPESSSPTTPNAETRRRNADTLCRPQYQSSQMSEELSRLMQENLLEVEWVARH